MANGDLAVSLPFVPGGELENQPAPDPPEAAPECRCRLWASETPLRDGRTSCNIGRGQREMTRTGSGAQQTIDRREALRRAALLLGGALAAPTVAGVLAGCRVSRAPEGTWVPRALTRSQAELVAAIADHILPDTDTPGARAVGAHRFVDAILAESYSPLERKRFLEGLAEVDARAARASGRPFLQGAVGDQRALLEGL